MKTTTPKYLKVALAALVTSFVLGGTTSLWAHDWNNQWDSRHHYRRDNYGYYDGDHYRHYEHWQNHSGYWDRRGPGPAIFINVD